MKKDCRPAKPLSARPLDLVIYSFYVLHIPITLFIDTQYVLGNYYPSFLRQILEWWATTVREPFFRPCLSGDLQWFASFIWSEVLLEFPVFFLILEALAKDTPKYDPYILLYCGHVLTTTSAILFEMLFGLGTLAELEPWQFAAVLTAYAPFFIVPLMLTVRVLGRSVGGGKEEVEGSKKKS